MMKVKVYAFVLCVSMYVGSHLTYADTAIHIYECIVNGQHVFSDHVCGDNAVDRDVVVVNRMDKVDSRLVNTHSVDAKPPQPKHIHSQRGADAVNTRQQRCAKIRKSKEALNDRMRAGFSARQDEKLHERLRKLDDDYFELRCSST